MTKPTDEFSPTVLTALLELSWLAVTADGEVSPDERKELIAGLAATSGLARAAIQERLSTLTIPTSDEGRSAHLAAIAASLPAESRRDAFVALVRLTAADGVLRTSERDVIMDAADALGVEGGEAADIVREVTPQAD